MLEWDVRAAKATEDAPACAEIYGFFVEHSTATFEYDVPSVAELESRITEVTRTHEWLVAERDERILGFAYASPWNPRPAYEWSCETTIYVRSGDEGTGIGRALYTRLIERLRERCFRTAIGRIALPNDASLRLHESLGYTSVGVHRHLGFKHGQWVDVLHTELQLNPTDGAPLPIRPPEVIES
jgi:L-amino acid N-acyltransferase YncA